MAKFELKGKYTDGTDWTAGTFDVPTSLPNYMSLEKPKKYAHNITIEAGNAVIGFTIFTSHPNAYPNALSVYANIGLSANQQIPASGVIGNNLPVYCIRMGVTGLAAIAVGMSVNLDSETEVKDIVVPL